jgi:hypothetical protein
MLTCWGNLETGKVEVRCVSRLVVVLVVVYVYVEEKERDIM